MLSTSDAVKLVKDRLFPAWEYERTKLDRIDCWYRWHHEDIRLPRTATAELRDLSQLSKVPCALVPVFSRNDPLLDQGKKYRELWNAHIRNQFSGEDAIRAWRRLHERPDVFLRKAAENQGRPRRAA